MSRFLMLICGFLAGALVSVACPGPARGDEGGDNRLARKLITAAEKQSDLQEVTAKYGRRAEIALTILQDEELRANLVAEIRDMNSVIATFPATRRGWLAEHQAYLNEKLARDRQVTALDREISELKFRERQMYEDELETARWSGKPIKRFHREVLLTEIQRLERESGEAAARLKEGIESAAREGRMSPRQVLDRVVMRLAGLDAPPAVEREFVPKFIEYAGGARWLDGERKPLPVKAKNASPRSRNSRT
jgi:hypothetical protein